MDSTLGLREGEGLDIYYVGENFDDSERKDKRLLH